VWLTPERRRSHARFPDYVTARWACTHCGWKEAEEGTASDEPDLGTDVPDDHTP